MQKVSIKAAVVKYIINVLAFAIVYSLVSLLLLSLSMTGFIVNAIAITAAVFAVIQLMKRLGPVIDKRLGDK